MTEETNNSYNPFKMWGSWVGFGIAIFMIILLYISSILKIYAIGKFIAFLAQLNPLYNWVMTSCGEPGCGGFVIFSNPIFFFLYGWAIHSLIRRLRTK